jgi:predicted enzyme related to lactoylglutathione lyase
MSDHHGKFCWYELMTTDVPGADAFYRQVVGWNIEPAGMGGDSDYQLFKQGDAGVGGMMTIPQEACDNGARPGWAGYISVDDVDDYAAKVQQAGGKVHRAPDDIPGVGRFAVVADPQGAAFVLFKPAPLMAGAAPPTGDQTKPGGFGWRELLATDWETAFDFYSGLFGWTKTEPFDMGPMGVYQLFAEGGETIGGMMTKPAQVPAPYWNYYIQVDSITAAAERIKAAGGTILMGPHQVPSNDWIIQGMDPQGATFAVMSPVH